MMVPHRQQSSGNHSKNNLWVAIVRPVKPPIKPIDDTSTRVVFSASRTALRAIPMDFNISTPPHIATADQTQHGKLFF